MLEGKRVLAVVPARSGSKGIPDKNLAVVGGMSLIARAARCIRACDWIDAAIISTDSEAYADEARAHGLDAPFLRPDELACDTAKAVDVMVHALASSEAHYGQEFDVALIVEPTSPLRYAADLEGCTRMLLETGADSVVAVSELTAKAHPHKVFTLDGDRIRFYEACGAGVANRQELSTLWWRNGVCYALSRACLLEKHAIITDDSAAWPTPHLTANIDEPIDLDWAEFLLAREGLATGSE